MPTFTTFLNLLKPNGTENFNEVTQLNDNLDDIDTFASGASTTQTSLDGRIDTLEAINADVQMVAKSSDQDFSGTTQADITNLAITVTSPGTSAVYFIMSTLDCDQKTWSSTHAFFGNLFADGSSQSGNITYQTDNDTGDRKTLSQAWVVTGLAAGSREFKMRGVLSAAGGTVTVRATHSKLMVMRVK